MGEINETSGVCEAFEAIETAEAKSMFSHLLVQSRTRILRVRGVDLSTSGYLGASRSRVRCVRGARTWNSCNGSFQ